ncbi:MAG: sugar O-acetyltransferase [Tessaracoccus sp.]|uniref:DapH/DapD/GlmU-related protein n=1 Tax=Tessaracoccus sp. TaxID=1971211 RepID=UPI001EB6BBC7|nr:DapH/DapD/GlmU-related protein [Tessaracoccus sp.]MBK7821320.1 sugar O-acetyltransferase [Tessaracoccus sp.]
MSTEATIDDLLVELRAGRVIAGGSPLHAAMHRAPQDALRITAELNGSYHDEAGVRALLSELTGAAVPESLVVFPPFRADFGRNITFGEGVFVNSGCAFQDQGGVTIGDGALIGHNVVIATLNHDLDPAKRADIVPAPVVIGAGAWIGSNATILPGVTIGDGAVVAAASVVTKDVPPRTVVVGSPARVIPTIEA